jgi:hypothetical protein
MGGGENKDYVTDVIRRSGALGSAATAAPARIRTGLFLMGFRGADGGDGLSACGRIRRLAF